MDSYYIKGHRKADGRNVYLKSECLLSTWVDVLDSLHDSEFVVTKITEKRFEQMSNKTKWCYVITEKSATNFILFINENYKKTIKILNKESKKLK